MCLLPPAAALTAWRCRKATSSGPLLISKRKGACAVCGKRRADGVLMYACKGCGRATGVRYCPQACTRRHWVCLGHRRECEAAQRGQML